MPQLLTNTRRQLACATAATLLICGCSERSAPAESRSDDVRNSAANFVNKVWKVGTSSAVAPGTLYVFLAEGTLVITSSDSKPALGAWKYESGRLTMVEQSIPYKVDVLKLSKNEFRVRSNNPGEPVEITLIPADGPRIGK